jgi:hypothetical protein
MPRERRELLCALFMRQSNPLAFIECTFLRDANQQSHAPVIPKRAAL